MTVTEIHERPEWMWRVVRDKMRPLKTFTKAGKTIMKFPSSKIFKKLYIGNSIVFACKTNSLLKYNSCVGINCYPMKLNKEYDLDLNWPEDWKKMRNSPKKIKIINTAIIGCGNAAAWIDLNNLKKFRHTFSHMTHIKKS